MNKCDQCKLVALMTLALKDKEERNKKLTIQNNSLLQVTQLQMDFIIAN